MLTCVCCFVVVLCWPPFIVSSWGCLPTGLLAARGQEADSNGDKARKMQRELDATRRDAEGMLQVGARPSHSMFYVSSHDLFVIKESHGDAGFGAG